MVGSTESIARGHRNAHTMVADGLRELIFRGLLTGGQPLKQEVIAAQFGVSRVPVREALRQLEGEGLITFYPHRGASVSELSYDEARELNEIRVALETTAIRMATPNLAEDDLRLAEEAIEAADQEEADIAGQWAGLNWKFHMALYAPARRPRLLAMIETLHTNFSRYLCVHFSVTDYKHKAQQEHRELLAICRRKDVDAAEESLKQHISTVTEMLLPYLAGERHLKLPSSTDTTSKEGV